VQQSTTQFGTYTKSTGSPVAKTLLLLAFTGLDSSKAYWMQVRGVGNVAGKYGAWSNAVRYYASYLPIVPGTPTMKASTDTSITAEWTKPQDTSGAGIASY